MYYPTFSRSSTKDGDRLYRRKGQTRDILINRSYTAHSQPPFNVQFATRCPAELKRTHRSIARVLMRGEPLVKVFVVTRVIWPGPHRYS
jgi:hypothetical protein